LQREDFLGNPAFTSRLKDIHVQNRGLFYTKTLELNQGAYLTEVPPDLALVLNEAYFQKTGRNLPGLGLLSVGQQAAVARQPEAEYSVSTAVADLFIDPEDFEEIVSTLRRKKNLILQGPPGVGKTYFSKRLAYALIGHKSPDRVGFVQFHPSYAYEDFVQGYRPSGGGFELKNGHFYQFCQRAVADPDRRPYVFIIDEINRAHLSKVLGELMMLIEADKRGPDWALPLAYARDVSDRFFVPENLYIIGLMNTADRSLAMVDYALRRRFSFVDLEPGFASAQFMAHLEARDTPPELVRKLIDDMSALNEVIAKDTVNLGKGFCIGHSYFCANRNGRPLDFSGYRTIIRSEVLPLLREYWPDNLDRVATWEERLLP
jgi:5-methylcytosine-specific restriction enzyme B